MSKKAINKAQKLTLEQIRQCDTETRDKKKERQKEQEMNRNRKSALHGRRRRRGSRSGSNSDQSGEDSEDEGREFIGQYDMFGGGSNKGGVPRGGQMLGPPGLPHSPDIISNHMRKHPMPQLFERQAFAGAARMKQIGNGGYPRGQSILDHAGLGPYGMPP